VRGQEGSLPIANVAAAWSPPAATGREHEWSVLCGALAALEHGRGGVVVIEGEAGIGKSHLVGLLGEAATNRGLGVLEGRADEFDLDRPLAAIADALLRRPATEADEELAGLLARGARPYVLVETIVASIEGRTACRPQVLVVEDLHWADALTAQAIGAIHRRLGDAALLLVLTTRPFPRPVELSMVLDGLTGVGAHLLRLASLPPEAVASLCAATLAAPPGPRLTARLADAGGNPLLVLELLRSLQHDGCLRAGDDGIELVAEPGDPPMPPALSALLRRRLAGLPPATCEATRMASVLGASFSTGDLAAVLGQTPVDLMRILEPAVTAGVLRGHGPQLAFGHDLVREAIYLDLAEPFRIELHRTAAEILMASGRPVFHAAQQLAAGAQPGDLDAVRLLRRAADALLTAAPAAAVDLLERALRLAEPAPSSVVGNGRALAAAAASIRAALTVPLAWLGRTTDAIDAGLAALGTVLDPTDALSARLGVSRAMVMDGRLAEAVEHATAAIRSPELADEDRAEILAEASLARLLCGDLAGATSDATDACALGEAAGNAAAVSAGLCTQAWVANFTGRFEDALALARRAVEVADGAGSGDALSRHPHFFLGVVEFDADRFDEGAATLATGRRLGEQLGTLWHLPLYHSLSAIACYRHGRWDDAVAELEAGMAASDDIGCRAGLLWRSAFSAIVAVQRDDIVAAGAAIDRARAEVERLGPQYGFEWVLVAEAMLAEVDGDGERANRLLQEAWDIDEALGLVSELRVTGPAACQAALAIGDMTRADAIATRLEEVAAGVGLASYAGAAKRCRGLVVGDVELLLAAVGEYRRSRHPLDEGMAAEDAAVLLIETGREVEGRRLFDQAMGIFERLGATRHARRAAARARALGIRNGVRGARRRPTAGADSLTGTEQRVLALLREGLTNGDIASRLFVSRRTVETHVSHVLAKLGASSRRELIERNCGCATELRVVAP
jgi:DNA-binding CsgD family transcriptional regulator